MQQGLFAVGLLLLSSGVVGAQNNNLTNPAVIQDNMNSIVKGSAAVTMDNRYEGVTGSPYVVARWLPAALTTRTKQVVQGVPLKYDVFQQRLLMRNLYKGDSLQLDDNLVTSFVLNDPAHIPAQREFRRFLEAPQPAQSREFVEVLHQGKYTLLKQYTKKLQAANYKGAYSADNRADEITDQTTYYLIPPEQKPVPIKLNMKSLLTAAPELATALKNEGAKRPVKTEADLVALLQAVDKPN